MDVGMVGPLRLHGVGMSEIARASSDGGSVEDTIQP
jgi:hypothetical protein